MLFLVHTCDPFLAHFTRGCDNIDLVQYYFHLTLSLVSKFHSHKHTITLHYLGLSRSRYVVLSMHAGPGLVHRGGYGGQVVVVT